MRGMRFGRTSHFVALAGFAVACGGNDIQIAARSEQGTLAVSPLLTDLGAMTLGQHADFQLVLLPQEEPAITVSAVELRAANGEGFSFLGADLMPLTLETGVPASLPFAFDAVSLGVVRSDITIVSDAAEERIAALARVQVVAPMFAVWPLSLDFGPVGEGGSATEVITVVNDGAAAIVIDAATFDDDPGAFSVNAVFPLEIRAGASTEIEVTASPTTDAAVNAELLFTLTGGAARETVALSLNDCANGSVSLWDVDGDGFRACDDCDDADAAVHPGASEIVDGKDQDCDATIDESTNAFDDDGDGYSESAGDCTDVDPARHPGGAESADGIDNDCDGIVDEGTVNFDDDGDGYTEAMGDCDDADAMRLPDRGCS